MIVISTIRAADIAESKAKNEGARYLKQFLELAQSGEYRAEANAAQNEDGVVETRRQRRARASNAIR